MHDEWKMNIPATHQNDWIYIGANGRDHQWSKIGKTTGGLHTRHRSPQNPSYFIFTAYNIKHGLVHEIESKLLDYLDAIADIERQYHFSTGNKSECFFINPFDMAYIVEEFIKKYYSSYVTYENTLDGEISRYQCDDDLYWGFDPSLNSVPANFPKNNLGLSEKKYFTGNTVTCETDLGDGHFHCHRTNRQGWRDEDGNEYWD